MKHLGCERHNIHHDDDPPQLDDSSDSDSESNEYSGTRQAPRMISTGVTTHVMADAYGPSPPAAYERSADCPISSFPTSSARNVVGDAGVLLDSNAEGMSGLNARFI